MNPNLDMETIVGKRSSTLAMHKQSRTISKSKPKIRIIHIFAPEIIKTDVANFRELVQRLTGKPDDSDSHQHIQNHQKGPKKSPREDHDQRRLHHHQAHAMNKDPAFERLFYANAGVEEGKDYDDEEDDTRTWNGNGESSGGFLNGLGDVDGFIHELGEFPYLPFAMDHASSSSQFHGVFAESQQFA
ncbi:PREDICTED: VQ motif-containing protein 17-like [Tarenaya hassleriana]|uniref:VQ motif-containing protein 17-like n=1 Tax=Tarenaya hassleriana TaxID=28532 RepID=UPI00053C33A3|nr:PREDICTED: VQ motif-containing protein 17-like [Tarenaya hassleriana]